MTKILILFVLCIAAGYAHGQNTSFGMNAGNAGTNNSAFGAYAADVVTGSNNCAFGIYTGTSLTGGSLNSFFGGFSGANTTSGQQNTFMGYGAGNAVGTASNNTFIGVYSGFANTASDNTFMGYYSGRYNTTGQYNTAVGTLALSTNATSAYNTAVGYYTLTNSTSAENTAVGSGALRANTTGAANTAIGSSAMQGTTTGEKNVAVGARALNSNTTGSWNVVLGDDAAVNNTSGGGNVTIGWEANYTGNYNNTVAIGANSVVTATNQVRIGNMFTTSIGGFEDWSNVSDGRFKSDVKEDVAGLTFINQLKPVSFVLNQKAIGSFFKTGNTVAALDGVNETQARRRTGFIAQQVEDVVSKGKYAFYGVDAPKNASDAYTIRYAAFVVPLVKAVQELSAKVEAQQKQIDALLEAAKTGGDVKQPGSDGAVLFQNSPNPFTSDTNIRVKLPATARQAYLKIYNFDGTEVKTIEIRERGDATITLSGSMLTHGVYVYTLVVDGEAVDMKRMVLTR